MKKYTNKILIIAIAIFLILTTVKFFIRASEIRKEIKQYEINK
jgi:hypothetical protein